MNMAAKRHLATRTRRVRALKWLRYRIERQGSEGLYYDFITREIQLNAVRELQHVTSDKPRQLHHQHLELRRSSARCDYIATNIRQVALNRSGHGVALLPNSASTLRAWCLTSFRLITFIAILLGKERIFTNMCQASIDRLRIGYIFQRTKHPLASSYDATSTKDLEPGQAAHATLRNLAFASRRH